VSFEKSPVANFSAKVFLWHIAALEVGEAERAWGVLRLLEMMTVAVVTS